MNIKPLLKRISKIDLEKKKEEKEFGLGVLLKRKRLELNLTQKEVAKNNCSISYLSKVERNRINPNEQCLRFLMESVKVSKGEIYLLENAQELLTSAVEYSYNYDIDSYEQLFSDIKDINNNQTAEIIKLGFYNLTHDTTPANYIALKLMEVVSSLDDLQLTSYALFISEHFFQIGRFLDAYEIVSELKNFTNLKYFEPLMKELLFKLSIYSGRMAKASSYYNDLAEYYINHPNIKRILELRLLYAELLYFESEYESVIEILNTVKDLADNARFGQIDCLYGLSYYKLSKAISSKEYLDKIDYKSKYFQYCINEKYELSEDKDSFIQDVITIHERTKNPYIKYFILVHTSKLVRSFFSSQSYLEAISTSSYYLKIYLYKLQRDYLVSNSKYKDAILITKKMESLKERKNEVK